MKKLVRKFWEFLTLIASAVIGYGLTSFLEYLEKDEEMTYKKRRKIYNL